MRLEGGAGVATLRAKLGASVEPRSCFTSAEGASFDRLSKICGNVTGSSAHFIARSIEEMQGNGEAIDWWERDNPERRR